MGTGKSGLPHPMRLHATILLCITTHVTTLHLPSTGCVLRARSNIQNHVLSAASSAAATVVGCDQWELDFYSRPVQGADGKKLWELLVTDAAGSFYHAEAVP